MTTFWEYIVHGDAEAAIIDILRNFTPELSSYAPTVSSNMIGYTIGANWIEVTLEGDIDDWPAINKPRVDIQVLSNRRTTARDMAAICVASVKRAMGSYWGHGLFLSDARIEQGLTRVPDKMEEQDRYVAAFRLTTRPHGSWADAGIVTAPLPRAFVVGGYVTFSGIVYQVLYINIASGWCVIQRDSGSPIYVQSISCTPATDDDEVHVGGNSVRWLTDPRLWVPEFKQGGYVGAYDEANSSSRSVFLLTDLWDPTAGPLFTSTTPAQDFTFADTTGGPVYSYIKAVFRNPDAGNDIFVDSVQAWQASTDINTGYFKWHKPDPGVTVQNITYGGRGLQGFDLTTSDLPAQGTLDSIAPTSASAGAAGATLTVTGTGSGFTPSNVGEVYFSDQPDSGGMAVPATYVDANTITFELPLSDFPNPDDQNFASTMYIRLPNPGGPANTGVEFDFV